MPAGGRGTEGRAPRRFPAVELLLWAILAAAGFGLIVRDLMTANGLLLPHGAVIGRDFVNVWAGARLAVSGHVEQIYSVGGYLAALEQMFGQRFDFHAFSYPPALLMFVWPLGLIGYLPALLLWIAATGGLLLVAARPFFARSGLPVWIAALLPASIVNIWAGHHGFVVAAMWLLAFAAIPKRPLLAGLFLALLTVKPHMGVLIPLLLIVRREWRTIAAAAAATACLFLTSVALFGWASWTTYVAVTAGVQSALLEQAQGFFLYMMPTPYVGFWLATGSFPLAVAAHLAFATAAIWIVVRAAVRTVEWPELGLMAATATFLVLPYAFNYDMAVVGIAAAMLLYGRGSDLTPAERLAALLALAAPMLVLAANPLHLPIVPFALLAFLWTQARCYAGLGSEPQQQQPALAAT